MKSIIAQILREAIKKEGLTIKEEEIEKFIEIPPSAEMGDYAFPCFFLAGKMKERPDIIATSVRGNIEKIPKGFEAIETKGAYINFFVDRKTLAVNIIAEILEKRENYGKTDTGKKEKTMVEFPSPNTNKPLHLGHLRNMSIGESVSRILEFNNEKVIRANLNNDRGIHICKSMLAYQKFGKNKKPDKKIKSDHFVGDYYVLFNHKAKTNEQLENEAHAMLVKWESGDIETLKLWKQMNYWALQGFKETYKTYGIKHDTEYYESEMYTQGKEIIEEGVKKKIFQRTEDGSVKIDLKKEGLDEKYVLRSDGTSLYITQDIYLAYLKFKEFNLTNSIYVTGNEQDYHFAVLFKILEKLGFNKGLTHLSYGMVALPEGKMKSREGNVVDADDLINNVKKLVEKDLKKRYKLSKKELEDRSLKIALAAIKYMLLKVDIKRNMIFNPKEAISFEGDTGPYLQYSYARACSILKKAGKKNKTNIKTKNKAEQNENKDLETEELGELEEKEIELVKKLSNFKEIINNSYTNLNPSVIANYSYQLCQIFNEFYHSCFVIGSEKEKFRLMIVDSFKQVLENSLNLLGIDVLEVM